LKHGEQLMHVAEHLHQYPELLLFLLPDFQHLLLLLLIQQWPAAQFLLRVFLAIPMAQPVVA
jgi:hypothetical protein